MGLSIQLSDGQSVIAYENASGVWFETADETSGAIGAPVLAGAVDASWIGLKSNADGGFAVAWAQGATLYEADYSSAGVLTIAPRQIVNWTAPPAALAFTSAETSLPGQLLNGDKVVTTATSMPDGRAFNVQLTDASGAPIGQPFVQPLQHMSADSPIAVTALATGGYALFWAHGGALLPSAERFVTLFDAQGAQVGATVSIAGLGGFPANPIAGLPDGGFVTLGTDFFTGTLYLSEFAPNGSLAGPAVALGQQGAATPQITVFADGRYEVSWGGQHQMFSEAYPSLGATDPPAPSAASSQGASSQGDATPDSMLVPAGAPITLAASAGWTSAAVLSNGTLAVVGAQDGGYGSHVGAEQTYDGSGAQTASAALMGYAGAGQTLTPEISALAYGFYQVGYAGSTDYEVYNAADQRVFAHNAYTSQTAAVTPLAGGGYVQIDSASSQFAVFDAQNNALAWEGYAAGSPGAPTVNALPDGDFVFTYAGSREIEVYDASGHLLNATAWGAPVQDFAMALSPIGANGFLGAWIGADFTPGPNAGHTAILIEPFFNDGAVITRTIDLAADLDPWHTQFKLQSHADGSVAVLWSQGGAAFGAEYGPGGDLAVYSTGVAEALSDMRVIQLPGGGVGLAWLQDGDAWAEIFDPATGAIQRADLGAATGDLSTVHALATASGGIAVSWHNALSIEGAVLDSSGRLSAPLALPGDLLGVDSHGHALTVHDSGGSAVLQAYALNDGLFWAA